MAGQATYTINPSSTDVIRGGHKNTVTAGTAVALASSSTPCYDLIVQAKRTNTGRIYVAGSGVLNDDTNGIYLTAGQSIPMSAINLTQVYINSTVDAEGVSFTYFTTV